MVPSPALSGACHSKRKKCLGLKTGATYYHALLKPPDKGHVIKGSLDKVKSSLVRGRGGVLLVRLENRK